MAYIFTRKELYDKVWSEPLKTLAPQYGVSDVGLAKACRKAKVPIPPRGYWAKKRAGKSVSQTILPPRFPGASDGIEIGKGRYGRSNCCTLTLLNPPAFSENLESVRGRIEKMVGKVAYPSINNNTHPLTKSLLEIDEARRVEYEKWQNEMYAPLFHSSIGKRKLRIFNALFLAMQTVNCKSRMSLSKYESNFDEVTFYIGELYVHVILKISGSRVKGKSKIKKPYMQLSIEGYWNSNRKMISWEDVDEQPIQKMLTQIVIEIILEAEVRYREIEHNHYNWLLEEKEKKEEEERERLLIAERQARELKEKREQAIIDNLLSSADDLQKAEAIRSFVSSIISKSQDVSASKESIEQWANWALSQADRIDPVLNLKFLSELEN